jgi:hypothetical protein
MSQVRPKPRLAQPCRISPHHGISALPTRSAPRLDTQAGLESWHACVHVRAIDIALPIDHDEVMSVGIYVGVPPEAVDELVAIEFREADTTRGLPDYVGGAVAMVTGALAVGANLSQILVAGHEIPRFVKQMWQWAVRTDDRSPVSLRLEIAVTADQRITVEYRAESLDPRVAEDMAVTALAPALRAIANRETK